uniref:Alginate lyase domain-containing protein n=1 Tax=Globisporangium ultimum (strain ATCC 200006 / CBS 805.95 / DAOM BR144) TaxID=431595 RepID=K3X1V9_GLOUD
MQKCTSSCRLLVLVGVAVTAALEVSRVSASCAMGNSSGVFKHPGMLHTASDLAFMKKQVGSGLEPWKSGFEMLTNNSHSSLKYKPNAQVTVYRGFDGTNKENYGRLYNDAAAAYALALRWKVTGEDNYADNAVTILNAWATTLTGIGGTSDRFLASGIYGYQLANAAEIMRDYKSWAATDFKAFASMMLKVFYSMNHDFLVRHNDAKIDHYWANWDLANMASMISIGILADRADIYDEAVNYFMHGAGNGAIEHAVWKIYPDGLGQVQESGRDQGHSTLVMSLMGTFVQMAYNQDCDLFAYDDNRVLKGAEYVAKYNLGFDVNYTTYKNSDVTQTVISENGRGTVRPAWELFYNHYVVKKGLGAPYVEAFAKKVHPEGGGGNYGPNSGGYDQLGYGTLVYSLNPSGADDEISAPSPETTKSPAPSAIADTPAPAGSSTSSSGSDVGDEADADTTDPVASTTNKPTPMPSPSTRICGVKRSV